ncbi:MAG: hypothetical protein JF606_11155 [Burkholderiales bacterium]|nr:hypothetical protein [Burkholderiales bacterium]
MAIAMIYPEAAKLKLLGSGSLVSKELTGVYLSQARTVLHWAPELADPVLAGADPLDRAYEAIPKSG